MVHKISKNKMTPKNGRQNQHQKSWRKYSIIKPNFKKITTYFVSKYKKINNCIPKV